MIQIQHLTKRFAAAGATVVALNDINLEIQDGDIYGIIGMSGAGKSTLVRCNGIGPGYIATPQTAPLREIQPDGSRHPFDQFIVAKTPAARWGNAEDLGGPAVFLASEASDFVNGLILYVDGGILAYIGKQPG